MRVVWTARRGGAAGQSQPSAAPGFGLRTAVLGFDGSLSKPQVIDDHVCDQCVAASARTAAGVVVAYRGLDSTGVRDIRVAPASGQSIIRSQAAAKDGWTVPGCPVNGPALDGAGSRAVLAWYTVTGGAAQVRVGFSADGGRTFSSLTRIDDGGPRGRVSVALLDDASAAVSWLESRGDSALLVARQVSPGGQRGEPATLAALSGRRNSGYPRMVRSGNELYFAWPEIGRPARIQVIKVKLSK